MFGGAGSSVLHGLSSCCGEQGLFSHCGAQASHCHDFSCCRARALGPRASVVAPCAPHVIPCMVGSHWIGVGDLLGSGIKPASPALAGGFFTTEPTGKPLKIIEHPVMCKELRIKL